jgi:hypothetical protein
VAEPSIRTIKRLFSLSGNRCAFPGCTHRLFDEQGRFVAEVCHIAGDKPGAKRYNPTQTEAQRQGFPNLIVLCATHHRLIDDDEVTYTRPKLREMKRAHEARATEEFTISDDTARRVILAMVGVVVGGAVEAAVAGNVGGIARELGEAFRMLADAIRVRDDATSARAKSGPERQERLLNDLRNILQYGPKGSIAYYSRDENHAKVGAFFVNLFRSCGWRELNPNPLPELARMSRDVTESVELLLLYFLMPEERLVANAERTIHDALARCGFVPISDQGKQRLRNTQSGITILPMVGARP